MYVFRVENFIYCRHCRRDMEPHLFSHSPDKCNVCRNKEGKANAFFPRSQRSQRSVNNTFISHEILAGRDAVDPILYYRSVAGEIASTVHQGLYVHTSTRWILRSTITFERLVDDVMEETRFNFHSEPQVLLRPDEFVDRNISAH